MIIRLTEDVMCVKHSTIVEENESRTKVESLGKIKAQVTPNNGVVFVYFHTLDKEMVLASKNLIWLRSDGARISLIPTLDLVQENYKIMKIKTITIYNQTNLALNRNRFANEGDFNVT